jgi:hypothetical protein
VTRAARLFLLGVAGALVVLIAAALVTARPGDRSLYPPTAAAPSRGIFIVNHGYHTGIVLPRDALATLAGGRGYGALIAVAARFGTYPWIEVGWGDEGFYREVPTAAALTFGLALRALFRPGNPSVLHVVGLAAEPSVIFVTSDVLRLDLSETGFDRMIARSTRRSRAMPTARSPVISVPASTGRACSIGRPAPSIC